MTSRAYEPTDDQVHVALEDLRTTAADLFSGGAFSSRPEELMPSYVLGIVGHRIDAAAEASSAAARSAHIRGARATLRAYDAWKAERRPDDSNGREPPGY